MGAGAWGTALATTLAAKAQPVWLHSWQPEQAARLERDRVNALLPGVVLGPQVHVTSSYREALGQASWVLLVVPAQAMRSTLEHARSELQPGARLISACKGIEVGTNLLMHQVIAEVLGPDYGQSAVHLSGPSFAKEVAAGVPTNLVAAANSLPLAEAVQALLATERLRVYTSDDPIGVAVGGALKNVIAIAAGACAGLGFGYNAQAALITRGLAEMTRLALALGGRAQTLAGLSGLGDLILSSSYDVSRNRTLGALVGRGHSPLEALERLGGVAEGYATAQAVHELARVHSVDLPICEEVYQVLFEGKQVLSAVSDLLARPLKPEWT